PCNEAVAALKAGEVKQWKKYSGYHQRSIAETAMYRFKQLIGPKLSLRNYNVQVGESLAGVKVMKKLIGPGMPARQPVN
ncbi:IS5/IS1182 family transposase, partial [Aeromonas veronii]|nr:IS5/IS1182 family transposase [Aeromonas veronii]